MQMTKMKGAVASPDEILGLTGRLDNGHLIREFRILGDHAEPLLADGRYPYGFSQASRAQERGP